MKNPFSALIFAAVFSLSASTLLAETVIDFEDLSLVPDGFYNGNTGVTNTDGWSSGGAFFNNSYDTSFGGFWSGWSYSNVIDTTTPGPQNQYASFAGGGSTMAGGVAAGGNYAVGFGDGAFINLPDETKVSSLRLTNSTFAAIAMRDGIDTDAGGTQFVTGAFGSMASVNNPPFDVASLDPNGDDFLRITFTGKDALNGAGNDTGAVTAYLADYRADKSDNAASSFYAGADYVLDQWLNVDLNPLGGAKSLVVSLESTDIGVFGPNTPSYYAIDNLTITAVPEPGHFAIMFACGLAIAVKRLRIRRKASAAKSLVS